MRNRKRKNTWLITDSYPDIETGFILTETSRFYGTLTEAMEQHIQNVNTFDLRFQAYSPDDQASTK